MFVKNSEKKGRPAKKKAFYKKITNKKVEGVPQNPLFVTTFLNPLPPYDIILRIISR